MERVLLVVVLVVAALTLVSYYRLVRTLLVVLGSYLFYYVAEFVIGAFGNLLARFDEVLDISRSFAIV